MVGPDELFVMRKNNRNGQPDQGVCDIRHTIHSDEPFAMSEVNTNDSAYQDVCDTQQTGWFVELCSLTSTEFTKKDCMGCL